MKKKSVYDFYNDLKKEIDIYLITKYEKEILLNKKLSKFITRPGLALTGFFQHFESDRIQLIGETELLYLQSITAEEKKIDNVKEFFKFNIPMILIAKNKSIPPFFIDLANKFKVPVFISSMDTDSLYVKLRKYLDRAMAKSMIVPASLISVYNVGILIEGDEGFGKSETTLDLIKNGHQFISDDNVLVWNNNGKLIGEAAISQNSRKHYPLSIKGIGNIMIDDVFGVKSILKSKEINLRVIFSMKDYDTLDSSYKFNFKDEVEPLLGVNIPHIYINVFTNKNLATIIEMIAIQYLSKFIFADNQR